MAIEKFDQKELEAWLKTQPPEVSVVIAARAALRVFPLLGHIIQDLDHFTLDASVLPTCQSLSISWAGAISFTQGYRIAGCTSRAAAKNAASANAAAEMSEFGLNSSLPNVSRSAAIAAVAFAATASAVATAETAVLGNGPPDRSAANAVNFSIKQNPLIANYQQDNVVALNSDREMIMAGQKAETIAFAPLWYGEPVPRGLAGNWARMKSVLHSLDQDWQVWTGWYEDRVNGRPAIEELEFARATLPEKLWEQGPAAVNAEIKRLIAEFAREEGSDGDADLEQRPAPYGFGWKNDRIEAEPMRETPLDPEIAADILDELRKKGAAALGRLTGNHADPRVVASVSSFLDCIREDASEIREGRLLMRYRTLEADAASFFDPASEREQSIHATIVDLVRSAEDLVSLYPALRSMEASRQAMRFKADDTVHGQFREAVDALTEVAKTSPMVGETAIEALQEGSVEQDALTEIIETTGSEPARAAAIEKRAMIAGLQALDVRNFVSAALKRVGDEVGPIASKSWQETKDAIPRGVGKATEGVVAGSIKIGVAALVAQIAGPVAGLGLLIASFAPLGKRAEAVKEKVEADDSDEKPAEVDLDGSEGP